MVLLSPREVVEFALSTSPQDVTVTGFAGCGFTTVTDILGLSVYAGCFEDEWSSRYLLVMRELLTEFGRGQLAKFGLNSIWLPRNDLPFGGAFVVSVVDEPGPALVTEVGAPHPAAWRVDDGALRSSGGPPAAAG